MKILCIYNPKAGGGKASKYLKQIKEYFVKYAIEADIVFTKQDYRATEIITDNPLINYDALIAAGGDGSFFDILNAYLKSDIKSPIPLGIIPLGTGNSLSRDITKQKTDLEHFIQLIALKNTKHFDIGKVTMKNKHFFFANMMGIGFSVDVAQTASKYKFVGNIAYSIGILINTIFLKTYPLKMTLNNQQYELKNTFITISNSKYTGNNFLIAPKAVVDDGKLDMVVVNKISRINLLKTFPKIFDGSYIHSPFVAYHQVENVSFESKHHKLLLPDGEIIGELPIQVSCIPKAIKVIVE